VPDYTDLISVIAYIALIFVPLYIPIAVTIIGGIRSRREADADVLVVQPLADILRPAQVDRASVNTPAAPAAITLGRDALQVTARPVVEPV
jgi:hypothetical protein